MIAKNSAVALSCLTLILLLLTTTGCQGSSPDNWPQFRGTGARGIGTGTPPTRWNIETGENIKWKTALPGLAHSSPIIWGDRAYVTTAVSASGDATFKTGLYGDVDPVDDLSPHRFLVVALDAGTGAVVWEREVHSGPPLTRRHTKSSQANSTPVTDGERIVVLFGAVGLLAAYDLDGQELWKKEIGVLDSGWFYDPGYQWGFGSSPIIYKDMVIVQCDIQKNSFVAAINLKTGKEIWRTPREEIPSWSSPTDSR